MPYRDRATIQSWISEFVQSRDTEALEISVLDKNFQSGPDSGLAIVTLRTASTITYIHPEIREGAPRWRVTFEPRSDAMELGSTELEQLGADLTALGEICAFLQMKTDAALLAH